MSLDNSLFLDTIVPDLLLTDMRNKKPLLNILMNSAASQMVQAKALAAGGPGGFAKKVTIPLLKQHALSPTDGYLTETNWPSGTYINPDLSSAYPESSDYPVIFGVDKVIVGTHYVPDMRAWTHAAGGLLIPAEVQANLDEMGDKIEAAVIADMESASRFESATAGVGSYFALDTSSEANLLADLAQIAADFNKLNVPSDDRWLALPATVEPVVIKFAGLKSGDYVDRSVADQTSGRWNKIAGFNLVYTNNLSSAQAVAFTTSKYALVMPKGIVTETLRDKDRIGTYTRMYSMFGFGALSEIVLAADGNSPTYNAQRAGIWKLTVS